MPIFLVVLWGLFAYFLNRFQFLLWNWKIFQAQSAADLLLAFVYGVRFDLFAVAVLSLIPGIILLFILTSTRAHSKNRNRGIWVVFFPLTVLLHTPFIWINLTDAEFIHFLGRRYTFDSLFFIREMQGKWGDLIGSYWSLNTLNLALYILMLAVLAQLAFRFSAHQKYQFKRSLVIGFIFILASFVAIRGGLQNKPINFAHAQLFQQPIMNSLSMNSTFTLLQTIRRQSLDRHKFMSEQEMMATLKEDRIEGKRPELRPAGRQKKPNIVLIILESFSFEFFGAAQTGVSYTPFLDELAQQSLFFPRTFANSRRSIEGIGALVGGIPSLMAEPFLSSQYLTNHFLGAGTLLSQAGYHSSFFHGAKNGTMYFDQFMQSAGVTQYFGLNEYPQAERDHDGTWGIWDEPFFQFFCQQTGQFRQPFFSTFFSLSSHHPFRVPPSLEDQFPKGESEIHASIGYTDFALRKYFECAKQQEWFKDTIFIITADHTYKPVHPRYQHEIGNYQIPLLIYSPYADYPKGIQDVLSQQIDILPTILDLVGHPAHEEILLSRSVFEPGSRWVLNFSEGYYYLIGDKYWSRAHKNDLNNPAKLFAQIWSNEDFLAKDPLDLQNPETQALRALMQKKIQAMVQYFSQAMWDNKIYYPKGR
jgi:phosphoglycerol transferase MdoB-like AlkP superfamily enzyme